MSGVMRWNCLRDGCWKDANQLKFNVFSGLFPRSINFTDIDGVVEWNGRALAIEWKSEGTDVPTGQEIMMRRLSDDRRWTWVVVEGDAADMSVARYRWVFGGEVTHWETGDMSSLKERIESWKNWDGYKEA